MGSRSAFHLRAPWILKDVSEYQFDYTSTSVTVPFEWCFLDSPGGSPGAAAVTPLSCLLILRGCGMERLWGSRSIPACWCPSSAQIRLVVSSWEKLRTCKLLILCLGKRLCLLHLPPYFQSEAVVMCVGVTSPAGRLIQKIGRKQIIWEYKGRLISPLRSPIFNVVQFKPVTSPCNLLIFPCREALAALYLQPGD